MACARLHRIERGLTVVLFGFLVPVDTLIFLRVIFDNGQLLERHAGWFVVVIAVSSVLSFTTFYLRNMRTEIRLRLIKACECR